MNEQATGMTDTYKNSVSTNSTAEDEYNHVVPGPKVLAQVYLSRSPGMTKYILLKG